MKPFFFTLTSIFKYTSIYFLSVLRLKSSIFSLTSTSMYNLMAEKTLTLTLTLTLYFHVYLSYSIDAYFKIASCCVCVKMNYSWALVG